MTQLYTASGILSFNQDGPGDGTQGGGDDP